jgi:hypothetical protein
MSWEGLYNLRQYQQKRLVRKLQPHRKCAKLIRSNADCEKTLNMTPETEKEIRKILALQRDIEDKTAEVSKRLAAIRDREGEDTNMIVIDGELWKITRWGKLRGPITGENSSSWCLESRGKVP